MKTNGRAEILAVWGSPGSGKSVFSGLLAAVLEHRKNKVIIVSPNILTPMLPVFLPQENIINRYSVGQIFEQPDITEAEIAKHVFFSKAIKISEFWHTLPAIRQCGIPIRPRNRSKH